MKLDLRALVASKSVSLAVGMLLMIAAGSFERPA